MGQRFREVAWVATRSNSLGADTCGQWPKHQLESGPRQEAAPAVSQKNRKVVR